MNERMHSQLVVVKIVQQYKWRLGHTVKPQAKIRHKFPYARIRAKNFEYRAFNARSLIFDNKCRVTTSTI